MPLSLDLGPSHAKVDRAFEHLTALEREVPAEYRQDGPFACRFSPVDPQTGWCDMILVPTRRKLRLGVIVGDVVHNLRSALDYLVTALADAERVTVTMHHQFPIFADRGRYEKSVGTRAASKAGGPLGGLTHGLGLVEQVQPYHRAPDPRDDPLWLVHRFSNADKHRQITTQLPIPLGSVDIAYQGVLAEKEMITEIPDWAPDREAVICRLRFDPPVAYNLRVTSPLKVAVVYSTPAFGSEPMHSVTAALLRQACDHVRLVVRMFEML